MAIVMLIQRDEMSNLYKGPYIEPSCKFWFHLAKWYQELKCEKFLTDRQETDDKCQVITKDQMGFGQVR